MDRRGYLNFACGLVALAIPSDATLTFPLTEGNVRSINGEETLGGQSGANLIRKAEANYPGDGSGSDMEIENLPNARVISNTCFNQSEVESSTRGLTDLIWQFGQFLDHDIGLTPHSSDAGTLEIPMPEGDIMGSEPMPFLRSVFDSSTGTGAGNPRSQINLITSVIDGSAVYGSSKERERELRAFEGGRLAVLPSRIVRRNSFYDLPPLNPNLLDNEVGLSELEEESFLLMGDVRGNEQVGLIAMHTLFLREHNRLADKIAKQFPSETDERIYQVARKIVGAEIQKIVYDEFLPALLGNDYAPKPSEYRGYDPTLNAGIANEFSGGAYRFGHSMLSPVLNIKSRTGDILSTVALRDAFFNPEYIKRNPVKVDQILYGLYTQRAQQIDTHVISDVRNFLFGPIGEGGLDLVALNIMRGRDLGLPAYNDAREAYGLQRKTGFMQVTKNLKLRAQLNDLYDGNVDKMELWVGGLAEEHVSGGAMGELFATIIAEQFDRLMHADPFFYLNDKDMQSPAMRLCVRMENIRLSTIVARNTRLGASTSGNLFFEGGVEPAAIPKEVQTQVLNLDDTTATITVPTTTTSTTTTARRMRRRRRRRSRRPIP